VHVFVRVLVFAHMLALARVVRMFVCRGLMRARARMPVYVHVLVCAWNLSLSRLIDSQSSHSGS
jgi:hypothetical protein